MKDLKVSDLMTDEVITVNTEDTLAIAYDLMNQHYVRHLPVVGDRGELEGMLSHRDLVRAALFATDELPYSEEERFLEQLTVGETMTTAPESVTPDTPIEEAARLLLDFKFGCVPVVEGLEVVGILTEADFIKFVLRSIEAERESA